MSTPSMQHLGGKARSLISTASNKNSPACKHFAIGAGLAALVYAAGVAYLHRYYLGMLGVAALAAATYAFEHYIKVTLRQRTSHGMSENRAAAVIAWIWVVTAFLAFTLFGVNLVTIGNVLMLGADLSLEIDELVGNLRFEFWAFLRASWNWLFAQRDTSLEGTRSANIVWPPARALVLIAAVVGPCYRFTPFVKTLLHQRAGPSGPAFCVSA